jgi:hypothetical protein
MSNIEPEDHNEWLLAVQGVHQINAPTVLGIPSPRPKVTNPMTDAVFTHDLHGMTVDDAFHYLGDLMEDACEYNIAELRIITGKSGSIYREFHSWMNTPYFRQFVRGVRLEANGGSYLVFLLSK